MISAEPKSGDVGQKVLIKVKNTKVTMDGEGTAIRKCESIESSTEVIHHSSISDPAITMIGYRFRYNMITALLEEKWEEKFLELIEYKSMHGNCDVPKTKGSLWHWVQRQINCFRFVWSRDEKFCVNHMGMLILTANRVERFNSLGVKWMLSPSNDTTITTAELKVLFIEEYITQNLEWENNYSALLDYKLKHGHCYAPRPLLSWVNRQKLCYTLQISLTTFMTPDQAEKLNTLGINWDTGKQKQKSSKWYLQFDALYSYQLKYKNTNVRQSVMENSTISAWVRKQRSEFKIRKPKDINKICLLNEIYLCRDEQSESLEEENSFPPELSTWEIRFSELADYKLNHGDCNVPDEYPLNSKLGLWVKYQRFLYKLGCGYQNEHPLFMDSRSYTKLNELGFSWSTESNCVDELQRYDNLVENKLKHDDILISRKRNLDSCNAKEKGSHKKERKEKN